MELKNPIWNNFAKKYKKIIYVVPTRFPKDYFKLAFFASKNNMKTNFGYFSRVNKNNVKKENTKLLEKINKNNFDQDSLYVFFHPGTWEMVTKSNPKLTMIIDGYKILAP